MHTIAYEGPQYGHSITSFSVPRYSYRAFKTLKHGLKNKRALSSLRVGMLLALVFLSFRAAAALIVRHLGGV